MEFATRPSSDKTNMVVIVPVMDKSIKLMQPIKPLNSRLQPELVGVWNSRPELVGVWNSLISIQLISG